jgi:hypothetical protein
MDSSSMIYIPSLIKTGTVIWKLIGGGRQTHRQYGDLIGLLLFFENKESRLRRFKNILEKVDKKPHIWDLVEIRTLKKEVARSFEMLVKTYQNTRYHKNLYVLLLRNTLLICFPFYVQVVLTFM